MHLYSQLLSRDPLVTVTELQNVNVFDTLPDTLSTEATGYPNDGPHTVPAGISGCRQALIVGIGYPRSNNNHSHDSGTRVKSDKRQISQTLPRHT